MATIAIARSAFGGDDKWQRATCPSRAASAHLHGQMFVRTFGHGDNDEKYDEEEPSGFLSTQETALPQDYMY